MQSVFGSVVIMGWENIHFGGSVYKPTSLYSSSETCSLHLFGSLALCSFLSMNKRCCLCMHASVCGNPHGTIVCCPLPWLQFPRSHSLCALCGLCLEAAQRLLMLKQCFGLKWQKKRQKIQRTKGTRSNLKVQDP